MDPAAFQPFTAALNYSVFVLTVPPNAEGRASGCLVGFATQCSISPARFLVCVSKRNRMFRALDGAVYVGLHLLGEGDRDQAAGHPGNPLMWTNVSDLHAGHDA